MKRVIKWFLSGIAGALVGSASLIAQQPGNVPQPVSGLPGTLGSPVCYSTPQSGFPIVVPCTGSSLPTAPATGYLPVSTGAGSTYAAQSKVALDPRDYGADFNGGFVADATTTSGSSVISCPHSDCNFPSNIGTAHYIVFATLGDGTSCLDNASITFGGNLQTTATAFTNANSITVTGTSNTTGTGTTCLGWFPKDSTTALTAWWTAGGCRGTYQMPYGVTFASSPVMQNLTNCPGAGNTGQAYPGQTVNGAGVGSTYIVPSPNFNYSSIIGTQGTNCAIGNLNIEHLAHFTVYGLGTRAATTLNACLLMVGQATSAFRIDGVGWNARGGGGNLNGIQMIGSTDSFNLGGANFFGSTELNMTGISPSGGVLMQVENNFFSGNNSSTTTTCVAHLSNNATVTAINNSYSGGCVQIDSGTTWLSNQEYFNGPNVAAPCVYANGGNLYLHASQINVGGGCNPGLDYSLASAVTAENSTINGITGIANSYFYDFGGNNFSGTNTLNGTIWPLSTWVVAVPAASSNITLGAGFGTSPSVAVASNVDERHITLTVTAGSGAQTQATSTITYTFPRVFIQPPGACSARQIGGTNTPLTFFTTTPATTTSVVFTPTAVATASATMTLAVDCQ